MLRVPELRPDTVSYNAAITACARSRRWQLAVGLFAGMPEAAARRMSKQVSPTVARGQPFFLRSGSSRVNISPSKAVVRDVVSRSSQAVWAGSQCGPVDDADMYGHANDMPEDAPIEIYSPRPQCGH